MAAPELIPLPAQVARWAAVTPDAPAVEDGVRALTYGALDASANRLAHAVLRVVGPGPTVAVFCDHTVDRVTAALAALKSGRALVVLDATYPDPALADLIAHADAGAIIADGAHGDRARRLAGVNRPVIVVGRDEGAEAGTAPDVPVTLETIGAIRYTSGSTGRPKGVVHSHRTLAFFGASAHRAIGLTPEDRVALFNPFWLSHVGGAFASGASLQLYDLKRQGLTRIGAWLDARGITFFAAFPTAFRQVAASAGEGFRAPSVRCVALAGEPVLASDAEAARRLFSPSCRFVNDFGSTELAQIANFAITSSDPLPPGTLPAGLPVQGVEILVLGDDGLPLPAGERGMVAIRCASLTSGYWREPELTRAVYVPDPEIPGGTLYRTGDIGWLEGQGCLHVAGRADQQVKVRGHRVLPGEVEQALLAHPAVAEAAVRAIDEGPDGARLAGYVVIRPEASVDFGALRAFLGERLPIYMVPTWLTALARMPQTGNGKVDRNALPPPDVADAPDHADAVERALAILWQGLLRIPSILPTDDFFGRGGDSLSATALILAIARDFQVEILPQDLAGEGATLAGQAALVRRRRSMGNAVAAPADVDFAELGAAPEGRRNRELFYVDSACALRRARPGARWGAIAINSLGFRGPDVTVPKPAGVLRLAFLGDSITFDAHAAGNERTWPHVTAAALGRTHAVDYVNAALPGYGSQQLLVLYDAAVANLDPDVVVIAITDMNVETARFARARGTYSGIHDRPSQLARRWSFWARCERTYRSVHRRLLAMAGDGLADLPAEITRGFAGRLEALVAKVRASGATPVLVLPPRRLWPDLGPLGTFRALSSSAFFNPHLAVAGFHRANALFEATVVEVARAQDCRLVDARGAVPPDGRHFHDSVHLTARGGARLAAVVAAALAEELTTESVPKRGRSVR